MNRSLYFSVGGSYSSAGMRGGAISHELSGCPSRRIFNSSVRDSIVVVLKDRGNSKPELDTYKNRNNLVILDIIDWVDVNKYNPTSNINSPNFFPDLSKEYYSGYIVNSEKMKAWWYANMDPDDNKPIFVIPHHGEERFRQLPWFDYGISPYFYYLGYPGHEKQNCLHLDFLLNASLLNELRFKMGDNQSYYKNKPVHGVQLNIRAPGSWEYCFKPSTKLAVSAALESLIITSYDWAVQDILPSDYPYLLRETDQDSVVAMFDKVKQTFLDQEGQIAAEMLAEVRSKTSLKNSIIPQYLSIEKYFS